MNCFFDDDEFRPKPVAERRLLARQAAEAYAREAGHPLRSVSPHGRGIAKSFWGRAWCRNVEAYQEYESRLPAGRSLLKNQAVIDLQIAPGLVSAAVAAEEIYQIKIPISSLTEERKRLLLNRCSGKISTLSDLVSGNFSEELISLFCNPEQGIFPTPEEIRFDCNCPDWSEPCAHAAAVLYAIGALLDDSPELFFTLRGLTPKEFFAVPTETVLPTTLPDLNADSIQAAFGINIDL